MSGRRPPPEDREVFEREMAGVKPLSGDRRAVPRPKPRRPAPQEAVAGASPAARFLPEKEDARERWAADLGRGPLLELAKGRFRVEGDVDLHGLTGAGARRTLEAAVAAAIRQDIRCLRVVHGKGLHSREAPVLRNAVREWLVSPGLGRFVAAYREAPPAQGGSGATLVVLRRAPGNATS